MEDLEFYQLLLRWVSQLFTLDLSNVETQQVCLLYDEIKKRYEKIK